MVSARAIIEDWISHSARVVELTHQLTETNETCLTRSEEYEIEGARFNYSASKCIVLQRKTFKTLSHTSITVVSLSASLRKAHKEVHKGFKALERYHVKREQAESAE